MSSLFGDFFNREKDDRGAGTLEYINEKPEDQEPLKIRATVSGRVQGVGFRYSTYYLAEQLDVKGIVQNKDDGTVYVEAVADEDAMELFIRELVRGPAPSAVVDKVTVEYDDSIQDYTSFSQDR